MARLYVKIKDQDNVVVAVQDLKAGTKVMEGLTVNQNIPQAHKIALQDIPAGERLSAMVLSLAMLSMILKKGIGLMNIC